MKVYNYSSINCNRHLWHSIANALKLKGKIKDADTFEVSELIVVIKQEASRNGEANSLYGNYSCGRINIYPCGNCTSGTIFVTFLHELAHAWIYEYHEDHYFADWTEDFSFQFEAAVYNLVGGQRSEQSGCESYFLPETTNEVNTNANFQELFNKLSKMQSEDLKVAFKSKNIFG